MFSLKKLCLLRVIQQLLWLVLSAAVVYTVVYNC